jgi:hypothetical protein
MRTLRSIIGIISDLVLWGSFALIFLVIFIWKTQLHQWIYPHSIQKIHVAFHDANQISPGAPVNFMGVPAGYVSRVRFNADHVEVTLKTYPESPKIPEGSIFSPEFNGLAGGKSLEIIPGSDAVNAKNKGEEPIRLKDVFDTQMIVAKAIEYGADTFHETLGRFEKPQDFEREVLGANRKINTLRNAIQDTMGRVEIKVSQGRHAIQETSAQIAKTNEGLRRKSSRLVSSFNFNPAQSLSQGTSSTLTENITWLVSHQDTLLERLDQSTRHIGHWNTLIHHTVLHLPSWSRKSSALPAQNLVWWLDRFEASSRAWNKKTGKFTIKVE